MNELLQDHISFSQLSTVQECPYEYFLSKIMEIEPVPNAFAQAGALAHKLLANWAQGELDLQELPIQWVQNFDTVVTADFPKFLAEKGYRQKLFTSILTFLSEFDGFSGYEILGAEQEFSSSIVGEKFIGIIDLVLRDKKTGSLMLVDYKSCSLSSFKKNKDEMYKQLLLYSKYTADQFGMFPERIRFALIKENAHDERIFDHKDYIKAKIWAEKIIRKMKNNDISDWMEARPEMFRCVNLCNCRHQCKFGMAENHKRKEEKHETNRTLSVA